MKYRVVALYPENQENYKEITTTFKSNDLDDSLDFGSYWLQMFPRDIVMLVEVE